MRRGLLLLALLLGCQDTQPSAPALQTFPTPFSQRIAATSEAEALAPLPRSLDLDPRKVRLGARLFRDRRLSGDGKVACADCHSLSLGGAMGQPKSRLPDRNPVAVNVPSIFNLAFNDRFGWAGGYEDVGQQIDFAMQAPAVMRGSWTTALTHLRADAELRSAFAAVYADGTTVAALRETLALYALSLVTPNARFDRYLRGELALDATEKRGYDLFRDHGCVSCHQGVNIGGNVLQRFGLMGDYFRDRGGLVQADLGLYNFSAREEDRHVFRVPSLRNVALTAPYFHDASAATLEQAATIMARYQLGRDLAPEQAGAIAAFLRTLTGELEGRPL
ncbi:MAG TPA: cytochrome c peroxidase [Polyangiales bacterium]